MLQTRKEWYFLSDVGYIQVHAYTSNAQIPLKDVSIAITNTDGAAIALRMTNRSGKLNIPVQIPVPDLSASQSPNSGILPFSTVNLYAKAKDYEEIIIDNLQVFPDTVTEQGLEMIPLAEYPNKWIQSEIFSTPPQNL